MIDKNKLITLVMVLCFIYAGVCIIQLIYSVPPMVRGEALPPAQGNDTIRNDTGNITNFKDAPGRMRINPFMVLVQLFGAIISTLAGFSLMSLLRKKERKELTKGLVDSMTTPEEKQVIAELERNNGELAQSELVKKTKLSKVKVHRIVKRLESLNIVSKYPYGVTNKIRLEKKFFEEKAK